MSGLCAPFVRSFRSIMLAGLALGTAAPALADGAGTAYISNERGNSVTVIDLAANTVLATWPVGQRPRGIALSRDGAKIYVAVGTDNAVEVRDRMSGRLITSLPSGQDPEQFWPSRDGHLLYVANEDDAAVTAIDLTKGEVAWQVPVGREPEGVTESPDGKWLVVTSEDQLGRHRHAQGRRPDRHPTAPAPRRIHPRWQGAVGRRRNRASGSGDRSDQPQSHRDAGVQPAGHAKL